MDKDTFWRLGNCILFGIASGLPLLTTGGTLQAWMKNEGVDIGTIGLFALVGMPYSYKFIWSPLLDRYEPLPVGRRRSWMLLSQAALVVLLVWMATLSPTHSLWLMSGVAFAIAIASATQDIALDAYRREILKDSELALGASLFVTGYRIGLLISGALALYLSSFMTWGAVYTTLALWMLLGFVATLFAPEPHLEGEKPRSLITSVIEPLKNFFGRPFAWEILLFVLLYKLGDALAATMTTPFILDIGFSNKELGLVGKTFGLTAAIVGGIIGGVLMPRLGLLRSLVWFGIFQMVGILSFLFLASVGPLSWALAVTITADNITSGMGTAVFLAFLAQLCDKRYSATQYAILSSIVAVPRTMLAAGTGYTAQAVGWEWFFIVCAILALPGLVILVRAKKWQLPQ